MMRRAAVITFWFTLAYCAALTVAWAAMARVVDRAFDPFGPGIDMIMLVWLLPPLAALAVFQLIFGLATKIGRGWRYWATGLPLAYAGAAAGIAAYFHFGQPWQVAVAALVSVSGGIGLWLALQAAGRVA